MQLKSMVCSCFIVLLILISFLIAGSDTSEKKLEVKFMQQAEIQQKMLTDIEEHVVQFATNNGLKVYNKDKRGLKSLSGGNDAIFISLYFESEPVFVISNVGVSNLLTITATDYDVMPGDKLEKLYFSLIQILSTNSRIDFYSVDPLSSKPVRGNNSKTQKL